MEDNLSSTSAIENLDKVIRKEIDHPNSIIDAERICSSLEKFAPGKELLDIGAGYGFFSNAAQNKGFNVTAIELNENSRNVFRQMTGFDALNVPFDENFAQRFFQKFDVVLLSQVLEHIPMQANPIKNLHSLIRPNGICVVAVPHYRSMVSILQGKRDMFITPPEHLNFFTIKGLKVAFVKNGFENIMTETISRYDTGKICSRINNQLFGRALAKLILLVLKAPDLFNKGMIINSYFRKKS